MCTRQPSQADLLRRRVGQVMRWAIAKGYRTDDPAGTGFGRGVAAEERRYRTSQGAPAFCGGGRFGPGLGFERFAVCQARNPVYRRRPLAGLLRPWLARWSEIDTGGPAIWTVPADRMKHGQGSPGAAVGRGYRGAGSRPGIVGRFRSRIPRTWREAGWCGFDLAVVQSAQDRRHAARFALQLPGLVRGDRGSLVRSRRRAWLTRSAVSREHMRGPISWSGGVR